MNLLQLFRASLIEPKKQAAVRIMTIGKIIRFTFFFTLLLTTIAFVELATGLNNTARGVEGLLQYIEEIEWLLYPFAFVTLFVTTTLYHFIKISFFAFFALLFLNLKKRRGEYRHVWRTAALSVTFPTFLSFILSFMFDSLWISLLTSLLTLVYLYMAAGYYPKQPPVKKKLA